MALVRRPWEGVYVDLSRLKSTEKLQNEETKTKQRTIKLP